MTCPHEITHGNVDNVHPEVIAPVDERSSPLELLDEVAEEMRLVRVVQLLDTPLRDYAAVICLADGVSNVQAAVSSASWGGDFCTLTPITWSSCARSFMDLPGFLIALRADILTSAIVAQVDLCRSTVSTIIFVA